MPLRHILSNPEAGCRQCAIPEYLAGMDKLCIISRPFTCNENSSIALHTR